MPDVKIKGYSGAELEYHDVPKVYLAAPESTPDNPVLVPFTYGEAVENVEIIPDFSKGDMQISVPDGYLARSAVVKIPDSLKPENIKNGESIAGVTGEYEGTTVQTETVTVNADFSDGDIVVEPSDGYKLEKAIILKPATLVPANIVKGVEVAGIVGTHEGNSNLDSDPFLKYFKCHIDTSKNVVDIYEVFLDLIYDDTGSYDVNIPGQICGMSVRIACER